MLRLGLLMVLLLTVGCAATSDLETVEDPVAPQPTEIPLTAQEGAAPTESENAATTTETASPPRWTTGASDYIFDQNVLHTFELTLSPEALASIDADPTAEKYVEGSLSFEGETVAAVGIRYKGSVGAFFGCVDGQNPLEPSGSKVCTKLSMKVKINWEGSGATFFGLKKLQFHSQNLDPSHLRERLGYWLFREMDVPAPRSVHARLLINGDYVGLFALTEQLDGRFTRDTFANGKGNLYKEVWPVDQFGNTLSDKEYIDALVTNEDDDPSVALLRSFGASLSAATTTEELQAAIEAHASVEELLAYVAVDRTIRHDDGPFHWYCDDDGGFGDGPCANHNFYFYEDTTAGTLHLIPWDLDNAFENIVGNPNPVTQLADAFGETTNDCEPFSFGPLGLVQLSASCEPLMKGLATFTDDYERALTRLVEGPMTAERIDAQLALWTAQIEDAVIEADATHSDAVSETRWRRAVDDLRSSLETARQKAG